MLKRETLTRAFGKSVADKQDELIIDRGPKFNYTRRDVTDVLGVSHIAAAMKLNRLLKKLHVTHPRELFKIPPTDLYRTKGVGDYTVLVAMCILDHLEYNVEQWWGWTERQSNVTSFSEHKAQSKARAKRRAS